ncbi:hypothetical protein PsorP6_011925 [Peronosclerospora sorghi]|uniref:Uncharacterized protein n=1 Tax=Peronosclerospora sorghi TaxID=230839 RepID=A0ACC0WIF1_9STRA|nr:hypothetical protein PsorP6_011925 [Peronosclerospora sorghi]
MACLSPDKKRTFTTMDTPSSRVQTLPKRRSILNDETEDQDMDDDAWILRTSSQQMSIANLISSPPTPTTSEDSVWTATSALADVTVKSEKKIEDVEVHEPLSARIVASSTNIPAAFLATMAFASPRDFFIATRSQESDLGTRATSTTSEKGQLTCTLCQVTIGNRVYSLKRHLFRHHAHVFRVSSPAVRDLQPEHVASLPCKSTHVTKIEVDNIQSNTKYPDQVVVQLQEALGGASTGPIKRLKSADASDKSFETDGVTVQDAFVQWLCSDVIPMQAVTSRFFRDFLTQVNPTFHVPQVIIQPQQLHQQRVEETPRRDEDPCLTRHAPVQCREPRVMKALCLRGTGQALEVTSDRLVPTPAALEALVQVVRAGICGTDLQMMANYKAGFNGTLGHEFLGIVRQLGAKYHEDDATRLMWLDKRVVGEINIPCDASTCATCTRWQTLHASGNATTRDHVRRRNHCPNRACLGIVRKDGAFAEFLTLPLANLYIVPDNIVDSHAVFAEPLAAACRILEQQLVQSSDHVVILGDGKLGLLTAEVLYATRAAKSITLVGKHREKLALVKHLVDAVYTVNSDENDPASIAARVTHETEPFDVCIECTGTPGGLALALELVRKHGTVVVKSTCSAKRSTVDMRVVQRKQVRVVGSRCGPLAWALRLLRDRKVDVQKYIHGVYPLERAEAALAHARQRGTLKIQFLIK